jgi:AAA+ ATPase superfamily predicted ATPase
MKEFNTTGPCNTRQHYMIESARRIKGVSKLIDGGKYFVLHAARQSGKTTFIQDLVKKLNDEGQYYAFYCSLEGLQGITDAQTGIPEIIMNIKFALEYSSLPDGVQFANDVNLEYYSSTLLKALNTFCTQLDKPVVFFFDEADCLSEGTLISFLRQLRNGYNRRNTDPFLHSVALVGMRNIRDYKAKVRPDHETLGSASPFNLVAKAITLNNFTKEEVAELYTQHTAETGQVFNADAIELAYNQSCGQPWLVNAIAHEVIEEILEDDYSKPVTAQLVTDAIQNIILRRDTHIDSLLERLKEDRVRKIIEPLILGENIESRMSDNYLYVRDLGLIKEDNGNILPANPIYTEVIIRTLTYDYQEDMRARQREYQMPRYLKDGRIDMDYLLSDFQQFWRENSEMLPPRFNYVESIPHFVIMAFLQKIVNGGGQIIREPAVGNGRLDLCLIYEGVKYPIELKIRYREDSLAKGIVQLSEYMDQYGSNQGWLCLFDRDESKPWDERIYTKHEKQNEKSITVVGL